MIRFHLFRVQQRQRVRGGKVHRHHDTRQIPYAILAADLKNVTKTSTSQPVGRSLHELQCTVLYGVCQTRGRARAGGLIRSRCTCWCERHVLVSTIKPSRS
jgi:hypothetical protein